MNEIEKKFTLKGPLNKEQLEFYHNYGFIHFENFLQPEEVFKARESIDEVHEHILENNITSAYGIPLKFNSDPKKGMDIVHRLPFGHKFSPYLDDLLHQERFDYLLNLMGNKYDMRLALDEKDGLVINKFLNTDQSAYKQMGWHTDVMRDIFMLRKALPMINVGIYISKSDETNGGLRIIPKSHRQSVMSMFTQKVQILDTDYDENEFLVKANPGDLVLHDGRIWHRVGKSPYEDERSLRIVMYIPLITGKPEPRKSDSKMPVYHKLNKLLSYK